MRTCFLTATVGLSVVVLGSQPAAWAQFSSSRTTGIGSTQGRGVGAGGGLTSMPNLSSVGTLSSAEQFLRDAQRAGAFVGADTGDMTGFVGEVGASGTSRTARSGRSSQNARRRTQTSSRANTRNTRRTTAEIRTTIQVGFSVPRLPPAQLRSTLATRLASTSRLQMQSPVEVLIENRTATLRGEVATEHGRVLAEQLARLEPGIWEVRNELTVATDLVTPVVTETPPGPSAPLPAPAPSAEGASPER